MGTSSIDPEGYEKLSDNIIFFKRNIKRFKEGFLLTIERNIENSVITKEDASKLLLELETIKF